MFLKEIIVLLFITYADILQLSWLTKNSITVFLNIYKVCFTCAANSAPFKHAFSFSNWYSSEATLGHNLMNKLMSSSCSNVKFLLLGISGDVG